MVELDPVRKLSAFEIYSKIKKHFEMKDTKKMGEKLGVEVDMDSPEVGSELDQVMRDLAEDIYDALRNVINQLKLLNQKVLVQKRLLVWTKKGMPTFSLASGERALYQSLQDQDADFRTVHKNSYGFVLKTKLQISAWCFTKSD